jgi:hypothetical protein
MAANISVFTMALAALIVVGCGGKAEPDAQGTPSTTATPTVSTSKPATTAKPTPTTLTREQAAKRYLAIIKPANAVFDEPKCKQSEDFLLNGGSWPPDDHPDWDDRAYRILRACYKRLVPLYEQSINAFQTTAWPADAKEDMADLISLDQAVLHCIRQGSRATSDSDMEEVFQCTPKDDDSADRVRARFGLPTRTQG